uniref:C-type lectin domain-containing protein n=1 Tax=Astatotilapia calliptera TaxID=8154 RepID=A0A3P8QTH6_ASTCA
MRAAEDQIRDQISFVVVAFFLLAVKTVIGRRPTETLCSVTRPLYSCYMHNAVTMTWADAELHCVSEGTNLVSIHGENVFTWIGLGDIHKEGRWMWSDGSQVNSCCYDVMIRCLLLFICLFLFTRVAPSIRSCAGVCSSPLCSS